MEQYRYLLLITLAIVTIFVMGFFGAFIAMTETAARYNIKIKYREIFKVLCRTVSRMDFVLYKEMKEYVDDKEKSHDRRDQQ